MANSLTRVALRATVERDGGVESSRDADSAVVGADGLLGVLSRVGAVFCGNCPMHGVARLWQRICREIAVSA
jgi:hypothetical protein